jgi:hypothetical protein
MAMLLLVVVSELPIADDRGDRRGVVTDAFGVVGSLEGTDVPVATRARTASAAIPSSVVSPIKVMRLR